MANSVPPATDNRNGSHPEETTSFPHQRRDGVRHGVQNHLPTCRRLAERHQASPDGGGQLPLPLQSELHHYPYQPQRGHRAERTLHAGVHAGRKDFPRNGRGIRHHRSSAGERLGIRVQTLHRNRPERDRQPQVFRGLPKSETGKRQGSEGRRAGDAGLQCHRQRIWSGPGGPVARPERGETLHGGHRRRSGAERQEPTHEDLAHRHQQAHRRFPLHQPGTTDHPGSDGGRHGNLRQLPQVLLQGREAVCTHHRPTRRHPCAAQHPLRHGHRPGLHHSRRLCHRLHGDGTGTGQGIL